MAYAKTTTVPVEKTRMEIESMVAKYGAVRYQSGWDEGKAGIVFTMSDRQLRFTLELPLRGERQFTHSKQGARTAENAYKAWEQSCRSKWRSLFLVIKAKLEAVEQGIDLFEHAFMSNIVMPNGQTVGEWMLPQIETAYESGEMPSLMLGLDD